MEPRAAPPYDHRTRQTAAASAYPETAFPLVCVNLRTLHLGAATAALRLEKFSAFR